MKARRPIPLNELLASAGVVPLDILGNAGIPVTGVGCHAQQTGRNEMFVAIAGTRIDSHMMLGEAVDAGASVLLVEKDARPWPGVTVVRVPSTRAALGPIAHALAGNPARAMKVCGVTGTNGKTTTTHLVHHVLRASGARAAVLGTLGVYFEGKTIALDNTTPGPLELAEIFQAMDQERVDHVVMEVSSHAADQHRIDGIPFRCGAFLNLTQDHLDYHGTMENYGRAKKRFFHDYVGPTPGSQACFNLDDAVGQELSREYAEDFMGFTRQKQSNALVRATDIAYTARETQFLLEIDGWSRRLRAPLGGVFNIDNLLAAASCAFSLGVAPDRIADALECAPPVPGRFEFIDEGQPFSVVVDYAHTPDALERLLRSARRICAEKVIVVFGCGGDRDRGKRPIMGRIAGENADFAIVTSDNPRTEDPTLIARQVVEGILKSPLKSNRFQVVCDRRTAIEQALTIAGRGDVVVIAGKGHEPYQDVGSTRLHFDDRVVAREILRGLAPSTPPALELDSLLEQTR